MCVCVCVSVSVSVCLCACRTVEQKHENPNSRVCEEDFMLQVVTVIGDLRDKAIQQEVLDKTLNTFGRVDILVRLVVSIVSEELAFSSFSNSSKKTK